VSDFNGDDNDGGEEDFYDERTLQSMLLNVMDQTDFFFISAREVAAAIRVRFCVVADARSALVKADIVQRNNKSVEGMNELLAVKVKRLRWRD